MACKLEVLAPVSILTLIQSILRFGSLIHSRLSTESSQSLALQTLVATAEHTAVGAFWEVLEHAAKSDIPTQWTTARVATTQPFLRWNLDTEHWTVHRVDV